MSSIAGVRDVRVTRRNSIKVGIGDGKVTPRDEIRCTRSPLWAKGQTWLGADGIVRGPGAPNRESLATENIRKRQRDGTVQPLHTVDIEGGIRYAICTDGVRRPLDPLKISQKAGSKSKKSSSPQKKAALTQREQSEIDTFIRESAPTYTGPITARMRELARDVISHRQSVKEYTR